MQVNTIVFLRHKRDKRTPEAWCRGVVKEVQGPVIRVQFYNGKDIKTLPFAVRDLRTDKPEEMK